MSTAPSFKQSFVTGFAAGFGAFVAFGTGVAILAGGVGIWGYFTHVPYVPPPSLAADTESDSDSDSDNGDGDHDA